MRAAAMVGRQIPKLCATDTLKAFGSCRLCLVEIEGRRGYPASCTTLVSDGIKVRTESAQADDAPPRRDGAVPLGPSPRLRQLSGQRPLRAAGHGRGARRHRNAVRPERRASHQGLPKDTSNPYFTFDQTMCIVCSRCVRACDEVQGTFALTIQGRGFASKVSASQNEPFLASECVSCGACVEACPTVALTEKSLIALGAPDRVVTTTCAYCGVGCSFKAEVKGEQVVRMAPNRDGHANHGHACVKGRFAYGYATHPDRITTPMIRASIDEPWQQVSWDEAIGYAASEFRRIQAKYGRDAIGGITSSRCTNEETFLVQKLVRAAFGNNNVDTCARVCHSPTGYGLKSTLGESAGTQAFDSVMKADVIIVVGANPTEGHPVFASQLKRRLRQGARLIVVDPREIALVRSPHIEADCHLQLRPGANVALFNAIAHVVVTEGLTSEEYVAERCEVESYRKWKAFVAEARNSPEATAVGHRRRARAGAEGGAALRDRPATAPSTTASASPSTARARRWSWRSRIWRWRPAISGARASASTRCAARTTCRARATWDRSRTSSAATVTCRTPAVRGMFEDAWGVPLLSEPGLRIPNMFEAALDGSFKGMYIQGEDPAQSDPDTQHVTAALASMECVVVQDLFLNETAKYAHVFLPGSSFLEKDGTFTNAERRVLARAEDHGAARRLPGLGSDRAAVERARLSDALSPPVRDHGRDRAADADLRRHLVREARSARQHPVAVQRPGARRHADDARRRVRAGQGQVLRHRVRADRRARHAAVSAAADDRPQAHPVQRRRADAPDGERDMGVGGRPRDSPARCGGSRDSGRRLRWPHQPLGRDRAAGRGDRPRAARRRLHHLPFPGVGRQRRDDRELRLGDELSGIQGDGRGDREGQPAVGVAAPAPTSSPSSSSSFSRGVRRRPPDAGPT